MLEDIKNPATIYRNANFTLSLVLTFLTLNSFSFFTTSSNKTLFFLDQYLFFNSFFSSWALISFLEGPPTVYKPEIKTNSLRENHNGFPSIKNHTSWSFWYTIFLVNKLWANAPENCLHMGKSIKRPSWGYLQKIVLPSSVSHLWISSRIIILGRTVCLALKHSERISGGNS